jgi:hypothetical protein
MTGNGSSRNPSRIDSTRSWRDARDVFGVCSGHAGEAVHAERTLAYAWSVLTRLVDHRPVGEMIVSRRRCGGGWVGGERRTYLRSSRRNLLRLKDVR